MLSISKSGYVPWYFKGATKVNPAIKTSTAGKIINAEKVPIMGTDKPDKQHSLTTNNSLKRIEFEKNLSSDEKETLQKMYQYSKSNNISTEQVDDIALSLAMDKWLADQGNQDKPTLDVDYLTRLIGESRIPGAAAQRLDSTVLQNFILHFGEFKSVNITA